MGLLARDEAEVNERLSAGARLAEAARETTQEWARGLAHLSDLQVTVDRELAAKRARLTAEEHNLAKLKDPRVLQLPAVWLGKRYRRAEATGDPKARERAEEKERLRWGGRLLELLKVARPPLRPGGRRARLQAWQRGSLPLHAGGALDDLEETLPGLGPSQAFPPG